MITVVKLILFPLYRYTQLGAGRKVAYYISLIYWAIALSAGIFWTYETVRGAVKNKNCGETSKKVGSTPKKQAYIYK